MEPNLNQHFPTNQLLDVSKVIPGSGAKKSDVVYFLEDLYTYPPKIKIQWNQLDLVGGSDKLLSNKIIHNPPRKSLFGVRNYADKVISFDFYKKKIKLLKQALENVPVYVIVNGRNELVLASAKSGKFHYHDGLVPDFNLEKGDVHETDVAQKSFSKRKGYKRIAEKALSTKSKKFGFMFLDPTEAKLYLDTMIERSERGGHNKRDNGVDKVGLSIHCIGMDTAHSLLSRASNVDFRFVPSLTEVKALLKFGSQGDISNELSANEQQLEQTLSQKVLSTLGDQGDPSFKGVPIYVVPVKDKPRNLVSTVVVNISGFLDGVNDDGISGSDTIIRPSRLEGNYVKDKESLIETLDDAENFKKSKTNSLANYIFFDREQALEFCEKYPNRLASTTYPAIYTDNLEDFLESWEESLILNTNNPTSFIKIGQPIYFIPSKRSAKTLEQYYNRPKDSLGKSIKVWGRRKLDKLFWFQTNYLGLVLRGYRI
tara:strand:- start:196 stop:1647 length:1452 start_codon:yes stop_codon:yes gene_type:complete